MRPNDGLTSSVFEVEISPLELFQDLGVLIVEGRLPELSKNGRRTGEHSWPVTSKSQKPCCFKESKHEVCKLVSATRSKIDSSFNEKDELFIEVFSTTDTTNFTPLQPFRVYLEKGRSSSKMILLERWEIAIVKKSGYNSSGHVNVNMVLQAVRSYLHFSQLSAWWNKSHGAFPHFVLHRVTHNNSSTEDFLGSPTFHKFPITEISRTEAVEIRLASLPRMDIPEIMFLTKQHKNLFTFDRGGESEYGKDTANKKSSVGDKGGKEAIPSHYSPNSKQILNAFSNLATSSEPCFSGYANSIKRKDHNIDLYCSNYTKNANCQQTNYSGEKYFKFTMDPTQNRIIQQKLIANTPNKACRNVFGTGTKSPIKNSSINNTSRNFISPPPPKAGLSLSDLLLKDPSNENNVRKDQDGLSSMLHRFVIDCKDDAAESTDNDEEDDDEVEELENYNICSSDTCTDENIQQNDLLIKDDESSSSSNNNNSYNNNVLRRPCCRRLRSKSASPHFAARQNADATTENLQSKPIAARRLAMVAGTIPVFNANTGLPLSSSPAPIKKPRERLESSCVSGLSKSSSLDDLQPCAFGLSRSAPAPASLLGNFEESVLNGRMPANGTLEGFWAELGASGSFCPKHVSLPIQIQYFSLSDDNAPSPYLGRITLQDKRKRKKKYKLPKKGTIQLTIFNPNNTVVKVFIVMYDFQDMPPCTRTFVRQKIVSVRQDPKSRCDVQTLHYLIHLSFVASKNSHVYLHTDIRVIFRQRVPDESLLTITDGPTHPKYTPITRKYHQKNTQDENDSN